MCVNFFDFYFVIFMLSNVLSVKTESLFKLSCGWSNMFIIAPARVNCTDEIGSFAVKI